MALTVQQLADMVQGQVVGDPTATITAARPLRDAGPGDVSFLEDSKYEKASLDTRASVLLVKKGMEAASRTSIVVSDPLAAFLIVYRHLHVRTTEPSPGIDPRAAVHPTARLGEDVAIQAFASIGANVVLGNRCRIYPGAVVGDDCVMGDDVILYPNAVLYHGCTLGNRVIVHANAVLGADGFGYRHVQGKHVKVPQLGGVEIGDDVEIGAATTVDRGTFQNTKVGAGTKLDNLVQIAHNCTLGMHNLFAAQVGMGGSTSTGDYVVCAGQVGIADHVHVGAGTVLGAKAGVIADVDPGQRLLGIPARPAREAKMHVLYVEKIPDLRRDVELIKRHLGLNQERQARSA